MTYKKNQKYGVIVAGASFAGLAVASELKARVLLIDRFEIGSHQISACGTVVKTMEEIGCEKAIIQKLYTATIHTENKAIDIPLAEPFCTVDYEKLCKMLYKQGTAEFLQATIKGMNDKTVITDKGKFFADIIVDCTGWQAVLAGSLRKDFVKKDMVSIGLETEIAYKDNKLRFFVDKNIVKNGAAWIFPTGKNSRFGVGSYGSIDNLSQDLKKFVKRYRLKVGEVHGGGFCYCFRAPVVKNIFVAGCAAGNTLPLTGEGIRRSIHFGKECGKIIQRIVDGEISLKSGQKEYRKIAAPNKRYYRLLLWVQKKLPSTPNWMVNLFVKVLSFRPVAKFALKKYLSI